MKDILILVGKEVLRHAKREAARKAVSGVSGLLAAGYKKLKAKKRGFSKPGE